MLSSVHVSCVMVHVSCYTCRILRMISNGFDVTKKNIEVETETVCLVANPCRVSHFQCAVLRSHDVMHMHMHMHMLIHPRFSVVPMVLMKNVHKSYIMWKFQMKIQKYRNGWHYLNVLLERKI